MYEQRIIGARSRNHY